VKLWDYKVEFYGENNGIKTICKQQLQTIKFKENTHKYKIL